MIDIFISLFLLFIHNRFQLLSLINKNDDRINWPYVKVTEHNFVENFSDRHNFC